MPLDETPPKKRGAAVHQHGQRVGGRSARVRDAVLDATMDLMREYGDAFGIPQVAARAGVHETSIYRRWGSCDALIVDAITLRIGAEIPVPDTGSLRGDLVAFLTRSVTFLTSPIGTQLVRATVPQKTPTDTRRAYWPHRLMQIGMMVERAIARGEIARGSDPAFTAEMLLAPLYFRLLITDAPLDAVLIADLADFALRSIGGDTSQ